MTPPGLPRYLASNSSRDRIAEAIDSFQISDEFLSKPPRDEPAVRIGFVSPEVGYGLFAARDFDKGEFIFHEAPAFVAPYNEKYFAERAHIIRQHAAYRAALAKSPEAHDAIIAAYPRLAASNGIAPPPFDEANVALNTGLGMFLVHGKFAGSTIEQDEYDGYTTKLRSAVEANPKLGDDAVRKACNEYFRHYAFDSDMKLDHGGSGMAGVVDLKAARAGPSVSPEISREACIYLLGSLINHCCAPSEEFKKRFVEQQEQPRKQQQEDAAEASDSTTTTPPIHPPGPNCVFRIGPSGLARFVLPRHILVEAKRDIREGEQLTWVYGKRKNDFICECEVCKSTRGFMGHTCHVL